MAYLNYTLKFEAMISDDHGERLRRNMGQYLEKSNIHLEKCTDITCENTEDYDLLFSQYDPSDILGYVSLNYLCDFSGSVRAETFSASPIASKALTSDILKIDALVLSLLCVGGVLCAAMLALMSKHKFLHAWLINIWINFSFLFFESTNRVPSSTKARMVLTTWLFTALLITIEVGSYLKTSFTVTTYDYIDRYQDAFKYDKVSFIMDLFTPVKAVKCTEKERKEYSRVCRNLGFPSLFLDKLTIPENTPDRKGEKVIWVVTPTDLKKAIRNEYNEIRQSGRLFYLGQSPVEVPLYIVTKDKFRRDQFFTEKFIRSVLVVFESNCGAYEEFEGGYMLESILWKKSTEEGTELYLEDSLFVFNLWLFGMSVSVVVFLLEVCSYFAELQLNKKNPPRI